MMSNSSWDAATSALASKLPFDAPYSLPVIITATAAIAILIALLLLNALAVPRLDPREPPLVKPRVPVVGHIIGLLWHQADYHKILPRRTGRKIATLPVLNGKIYAIWDPTLVAAGLRNKHLSTSPQIKAATRPLTQISDEAEAIIQGPSGDQLVDDVVNSMAGSFVGDHLQQMIRAALSILSRQLSGFGHGANETVVPNVWLWMRHLMTEPTGKAVYGDEDPFSKHPDLEQALWDFEASLLKLVVNVLPSFIAPTGNRARSKLVEALTPFYTSHHDNDSSTSEFARRRAGAMRAHGISGSDVARIETLLPFASMTNTVPTLFWLFTFIVSRPRLVAELREELESSIMRRDGDDVTLAVNASAIEERCPLLWSCYRETLRLTIQQVSTRTVMQDTTISDARGREYLLREGAVVQMALGTLNALEEYWGPDVDEFKPARFLNFANRSKTEDGPGSPKAMRATFQPFGGGVHLCPGRIFAATEIMAVVVSTVLGYEVKPLDGKEWNLPRLGNRSMIDAVTKPAKEGHGFGVTMKRRPGWEKVQWKFDL